jgi:hypothetical protein
MNSSSSGPELGCRRKTTTLTAMISHITSGRMAVGLTSRIGSIELILSPGPAIMPVMDHKPLDELLTELETADPAEAPEIADAIAADLSEALETDDGDEPETPSRH